MTKETTVLKEIVPMTAQELGELIDKTAMEMFAKCKHVEKFSRKQGWSGLSANSRSAWRKRARKKVKDERKK